MQHINGVHFTIMSHLPIRDTGVLKCTPTVIMQWFTISRSATCYGRKKPTEGMPDTCIKQSSTIHLPTAKLTKFGIPSFFDAMSREFPRTTQVTNVQKKQQQSMPHFRIPDRTEEYFCRNIFTCIFGTERLEYYLCLVANLKANHSSSVGFHSQRNAECT